MGIICIMDLKNRQDEYAAALAFIKALEMEGKENVQERRQVMRKMAEKISVSVGEVKSQFSARYLEEPMSISKRGIRFLDSVQNKHSFSENDGYLRRDKKEPIRYHVRIHFSQDGHTENLEGDELIHLQYLAMFLKQASRYILPVLETGNDDQKQSQEEKLSKILKNQLSVFIVPLTGSEYPFLDGEGRIDYSTYVYVSRYLRLLSKRYTGVIYGLDEIGGKPTVTSLDFRKNKKCKTHFPLILIDAKQYDKLFVLIVDDMLEELFSLGKNRRFRNSRDENPNEALFDFIAETDLYRIRDIAGEESCSAILQFLKSQRNITLMDFSLFAFMLSAKRNKADGAAWDNECRNIWHFAREISQGLRQVTQNSIQHTEEKSCFLSFYFHERRDGEEIAEFISRISRFYPSTFFDSSTGEGALELFISDLNEKEDMIDNFVSNLEYEWSGQGIEENGLSGHLTLMECRDKLAIRNFFSEYAPEDAKEAWIKFRQEDLIAHIGLSQFAQTAQKCRASFKVLSNKSSELIDEKHFFYHAYHGDGKKNFGCGECCFSKEECNTGNAVFYADTDVCMEKPCFHGHRTVEAEESCGGKLCKLCRLFGL